MTALEKIYKIIEENKSELEKNYNIKEIGIFGSFVRGENSPESDIDILVDFLEVPTLFKFINLENHLSDLLGRKVDLVVKDSLKQHIGKLILEEVSYI